MTGPGWLLQQVLEVTYLVTNKKLGRGEATNFIARQHSVAPQTVLDKYCRQLGLTASEFDRLLEQDSLADLKARLIEKFGEHRRIIEQYLAK